MLKSLRFEKGVVGRGVKAIIWEEKKNDLSSGCQQRKRLCAGDWERGWGRGPERAPLRPDGWEQGEGKGCVARSMPWPWQWLWLPGREASLCLC